MSGQLGGRNYRALDKDHTWNAMKCHEICQFVCTAIELFYCSRHSSVGHESDREGCEVAKRWIKSRCEHWTRLRAV